MQDRLCLVLAVLLTHSPGASAQQVKLRATIQVPLTERLWGVALARFKAESKQRQHHCARGLRQRKALYRRYRSAELLMRLRAGWRTGRVGVEPVPEGGARSRGDGGCDGGDSPIDLVDGVVEIEAQPAAGGRREPERVMRERRAMA